jgi:hypothetical protein
MNAPFQSVGIVFSVTIVHVVVIAVYSSRPLPESTFQKSIVAPNAEILEVMPEQLVGESFAAKPAELTALSLGTVDPIASAIGAPMIEDDTLDLVEQEAPEPALAVIEEEVKTETVQEKTAERWEDSAFAKRVSFPTLDGIIGKKSKKPSENKPSRPAPSKDRKDAASEPAPRVRSFSPVPKS